MFSHRSLDELATLAEAHRANPSDRRAQRTLAEDVTTFVHGGDLTARAIKASAVMFGGTLVGLTDADLAPLLADVPSSELASAELEAGVSLVDLVVKTGLGASRGAVKRLVAQGGVYVNNVRVTDDGKTLTLGDRGTETMLILRSGKKSYHIVKIGR